MSSPDPRFRAPHEELRDLCLELGDSPNQRLNCCEAHAVRIDRGNGLVAVAEPEGRAKVLRGGPDVTDRRVLRPI